MNEIEKTIHERAVESVITRIKEKKHYFSIHPKPKTERQIAVQTYILKALREKAEREKGCEYCNTTLYIRAERTLLPVMAPLTYADALEHELINITGKDYVPTEKRYCHVCGRKLGED